MSDNPDIFMPLFLGDFTKHIARLTDADVGSYLLILMDYWINGAPPDDDAILANVARCTPAAWGSRRSKLAPFFKIKGGVWTQKRVEEELKKARGRKLKAQRAAKARQDAIREEKNAGAPGSAPGSKRALSKQVLEECPSPSPSQEESLSLTGQRDSSRRDSPPSPCEGRAAVTSEERKAVGAAMAALAAEFKPRRVS